MQERHIKLLGIGLVFLMNIASGWAFVDAVMQLVVVRLGVVLLFIVLQWELALRMIRHTRSRYPRLDQVRWRVGITGIQFFLLSFFIQILNDLLLENLIEQKVWNFDLLRFCTIILNALLFTLTTIGMFEAIYYYTHFSRAELEKAELLKANVQSQYESLKGQVNPHFLFNSLNSLSSLIASAPDRAEHFVEELASVYRYLLRANEQNLIPLSEELHFLDSYLYLLSTRFGDNLQLNREISGESMPMVLPPLILQLLLENAVKHNIIASGTPLLVRISARKNTLTVSNNLQKKVRQVPSSRTGLANIAARYRLLGAGEISITETATAFTVCVPLLNPTNHARIDHRG